MTSNLVDLAATSSLLQTKRLGRSLTLLETTTSTMDEARAAVDAGAPDGHVVVADTQTSGRGTHGRVWTSPSGTDLYLSIVVRPDVPLDVLPTMTLAVGLGVARAIDRFVDTSTTRIKWPNDVLVDGRKCAGILVESRAFADTIDAVVVGIGLNCNRLEFDPTGPIAPTSLALASGEPVSRAEVLAVLLLELERAIDAWRADGPENTAAEVERCLAYAGSKVLLDGRPVVLLGVDRDGNLRVEENGETRHVAAGRIEPA